MTVLWKAVAYLLIALPAVAQSQAFRTITIAASRSAEPAGTRMQVLENGDLITHAVPVVMLLSYAYDVPVNPSPRFSPLPDWTVLERYDIKAKAPANTVTPDLPESEARSRIRQMVRKMLADRFGLRVQVGSKKLPVYSLTVASGGPMLEKSSVAEKDCTFDTDLKGCHNFGPGFGHPLRARAIDMDDLARYITNWTDLPVVNRTELRGLFTVNTSGWLPMRLPPPPPNATADANDFAGLPTIFTILNTLGLELNRQEDTLPIYTVERIERPSIN